MDDGDGMLFHLFAKEHIFVAVMMETLVERIFEHQLARYQEIGCVEVVVRRQPALFRCMFVFDSFLIHGTQVAWNQLANSDAAIENGISLDIIGISITLLEIKKIRIANLLPAIFLPLVWQGISLLF